MSTAIKCDRCGVFYVPYTTKLENYYDVNCIIFRVSGCEGGVPFDLCPDCMKEVIEWAMYTKEFTAPND